MSTELVKKPGYMMRAVVAWCIYNAIAIFTLSVILYVVGLFAPAVLGTWFVIIPLMIGIIASEWIIFADTIAPVIKEWIRQESYVTKP
jgi:hypothetical protein